MADEKKDTYQMNEERAKQFQAGFNKSPVLDKLKSAWQGLKTSVSGQDEQKPRDEKEYGR